MWVGKYLCFRDEKKSYALPVSSRRVVQLLLYIYICILPTVIAAGILCKWTVTAVFNEISREATVS